MARGLYARGVDDQKINPQRLWVEPHYAEMYVDDGTGVALTTPTSATTIASTPLKAGKSNGVTMSAAEDSAVTGIMTFARSGRYRVSFHCGEIVGVNSQALIVEAYVNDAVVSPAINAKLTQPATALAIVSVAASGYVTVTAGDTLRFKATASTGNFTVKRGRFSVEQVDDADPASQV
jgi:hypothetical protein